MNESNPQRRPVISVAIRVRNDDVRENLRRVLSDLTREDPAINFEAGPTDRETVISGTGELHLQIICDRILHEYKIPIDVGEFKVIYLETIRHRSEAEGKYIRQVGGRGQYAHVKLRLEPQEPGSGYQFVDETTESTVPRGFVEPVNLGIQEAMKAGIVGWLRNRGPTGRSLRRQLPCGRLERNGVPDRWFDGLQRGCPQGKPRYFGAGHVD